MVLVGLGPSSETGLSGTRPAPCVGLGALPAQPVACSCYPSWWMDPGGPKSRVDGPRMPDLPYAKWPGVSYTLGPSGSRSFVLEFLILILVGGGFLFAHLTGILCGVV